MKLLRSLAILVIVLAAFPAAGIDRVTATVELAAARAKWSSSQVTSYEVRFQDKSCWCLFGPYYGPIRNLVRSGRLKGSYYERERRDGYSFGRKVRIETPLRATVEDAFARVERLIASAPEGSFEVKYDAVYGYPTDIAFDDPKLDDEQWHMVADGFKPLPQGR